MSLSEAQLQSQSYRQLLKLWFMGQKMRNKLKDFLFKKRGNVRRLQKQKEIIDDTIMDMQEEIKRATVNGEDSWMLIRNRRKKGRENGSDTNSLYTDNTR